MEIYKLSDDISSDFGAVLKITDIRQAVKNENRVNVFVNKKYSFSLDVAQLVDLKLKVGAEITEEDLAEYKKLSEFGKLYQRTLEWLLMKPRSIKETRDYLWRKLKTSSSGYSLLPSLQGSSLRFCSDHGYSSEDIFKFSQDIISRLISKGYLDDEKFAEYYVENRFVKKGVSKRRLKMELMKKGIKKEIIERVLDDSVRNDEDEILKIIAKKRARYDDEKLIQYLCRQGFPYELAQNLVQSYGKD